MIIADSRESVLLYKEAFDELNKENGNKFKSIVAFSGPKVNKMRETVTEVSINGFKEHELPKKFEKNEYKFLIAA